MWHALQLALANIIPFRENFDLRTQLQEISVHSVREESKFDQRNSNKQKIPAAFSLEKFKIVLKD